MHRRSVTAAVVGAVLLAAAAGGVASAHIVKQFGPYSIALGWLVEPTYVGERNAVVVIVKDATGNPVDDIKAGDLTVSATAAGQSTAPLPLIPSFDPDTGLGTHGEYAADLIPTLPGDYAFHLSGSVHGTAVDETAVSSGTTFNAVEDPTSVQFPVKVPTTTELSTKVDQLGTRVQRAADDAAAAQTKADDAANSARLALAVGGILGGLGVVLGLAGVLLARRSRKAA